MNKPCDLCGDNQGPKEVRARCHLTAPLRAILEDGILRLHCYVPTCNRLVVSFAVEAITSVDLTEYER